MTKLYLASLIIVLLGCESLHKSKMTSFEPYTEGSATMFRFKSERNEGVYKDDNSGEAIRMKWLSEYLSDNNLCKDGFEIVSRSLVRGGDIYGLRESYYYVGKCIN